MSIKLDNVALLLNRVKSNLFKTTDPSFVEGFSKLEQVTNDRLSFSFYAKHGCFCEHLIESTNTFVGAKYLVANTSLIDLASRFKTSKKAFSISQDDNGLSFSTYTSTDSVSDNLIIKQYHGDSSEFITNKSPEQTILSVKEPLLYQVFNQLKAYGTYTTNSRPILLKGSLETNSFVVYGNQLEGRNFICKLETYSEFTTDFEIYIDGCTLEIVLAILDSKNESGLASVTYNSEEQKLAISTALGLVLVPTISSDKALNLKSWPTFFDSEGESCTRIFELESLSEAITIQQPDKITNNKLLVLDLAGAQLKVTKVGDLSESDFSLVTIGDLSELHGEWQRLAFNAASLKLTMAFLDKGVPVSDAAIPYLALTQVKRKAKSIPGKKVQERWLVLFKTKNLVSEGIIAEVATIGNVPEGVEV